MDHVLVERAYGPGEIFKGQDPLFSLNRLCNQSAQLGECPLFVIVDMAIAVAEKFISRLAVHPQRDLVGHRPAGHKDRSLLAKNLRCPALESVEGRIHIDDVVSNLRAIHRLPHQCGRTCHRVASQINHADCSYLK